WKFAFVSLGRPEYLQDSDIISNRFQELASLFSTRFSNNIVILFGCLEKGHIRRMGAVSWTGAH
ncbi:ubiquitin carboxyl-terminal hydrolase 12-like, partial [Trifolium medium]|nr:ubiquitin carboxyl-terminal hydrolase 12-like [Trifolium medium]